MVRIAHKYVIFDCTQTSIDVIRSFLDNIEILQTFLGELETSFIDAPSQLEALTKQVNGLKEALKGVMSSVVAVNEDEQKNQQNRKEKEQAQLKLRYERSLLKKYPEAEKWIINTHLSQVQSWLGGKQLQLIYRGSVDGFGAHNFHKQCNNKGETLTVIKSTGGYLFGGYTPIIWQSKGGFAWDQRSFVFTLTNPNNIPPTKYSNTGPNHSNQNSIYDHSSRGPSFGYDIQVHDRCNQNTSSATNFPHSFADSTGKGTTTFTGSPNFQVAEIEVFRVY